MNPMASHINEQFPLFVTDEISPVSEPVLFKGRKLLPVNQYLKTTNEIEADLCYKAYVEQWPFHAAGAILSNTDGYKNIHVYDDLSSNAMEENY